MRCSKCQGSGFYIDFGLMRVECDCPEEVTVDRESKAYKDSIAKIMKASKCSREQAIKIFDSEFQKIA